MKKNNHEPKIKNLLTQHLEKTVPEGVNLWPTISARLAERNFATAPPPHLRFFTWIGFRHIHMVYITMIILVVIAGLYWGIAQPRPVDAQEILNKAQGAMVLSNNSDIHTLTMTQKIDQSSSAGEFHAEIKRWYQEPGRWRVESKWTGDMPTDQGTSTIVSDGTSEWRQQGDTVNIVQASPYKMDDLAPWGQKAVSLANVLHQVIDLYNTPNPKLLGEETIARRPAYVLDLGLPNRFSNSASELNNGRRVIWVDKKTFVLLKAVAYSPTNGRVVGSMEVTHIKYNIPLDSGVFSFTPPQGAHIYDFRNGARPSLPDSSSSTWTSLAEARKKVPFPVFIPAVVPMGLIPEQPTGSKDGVTVNYRTKDGSVELSVLNMPAGKGLDDDTRKKGETLKLQGNIPGHFLNNQPEFGGPILWWDESGSYVAISGPKLTKNDLIKIAASMSSTADTGSTEYYSN